MRTILRPLVAAMMLVALMSPTLAQRVGPPSHPNELPAASPGGESNGW